MIDIPDFDMTAIALVLFNLIVGIYRPDLLDKTVPISITGLLALARNEKLKH